MREVDADTGFTDSFTHIHTVSTCTDELGLLNILLAGGISMGLKKMAWCSSSDTVAKTLEGCNCIFDGGVNWHEIVKVKT